MPVVVNLKPGLFDEALCTRTPAEIRGLEYANAVAEAEYQEKGRAKNAATLAKSPRRSKPAGRSGTPTCPAGSELLAAAKTFRGIRARALDYAGEKPSKTTLQKAEAYIAVTLHEHFEETLQRPLELKGLGLSAHISGGVSPHAFVNTAMRAYILGALPGQTIFIAGGKLSGIAVSPDEFALLDSEDWEGVYIK